MRSISFLTSANAEPGGIEFPGHETEARAVKLTPRPYILALRVVEKHRDESPPPTLAGRAPEWEPACSEAHRGCSTPGRRAPRASPAIPARGQSSRRGTRSPAPHHAATTTSGARARTDSADDLPPGSPMNSPPATSTSSATHFCDAISGLPHSSQKTRGRCSARYPRTKGLDLTLHVRNHTLPSLPGAYRLRRWWRCRYKCRPAFLARGPESERPLSGFPLLPSPGRERPR